VIILYQLYMPSYFLGTFTEYPKIQFKGHCLGYVNGTTVLHLNKKALPEFEIRIPSEYEARTMNATFAILSKWQRCYKKMTGLFAFVTHFFRN